MTSPKLSNIPLWNLLEEFFLLRSTLASEEFRTQLRDAGAKPIRTPLFEWFGLADDLLTLIVQRSILGVESYVSGAVWMEIGRYNTRTRELSEMIGNPFKIARGAGTAMSYYHHLPSLLSEELSLRKKEPALWQRVETFYRDVRNPLFHGMQFDRADPDEITDCLSFIQEIYDWIRTWHEGDFDAAKRRFLVLIPGSTGGA